MVMRCLLKVAHISSPCRLSDDVILGVGEKLRILGLNIHCCYFCSFSFGESLERACVTSIEDGNMTKDLAGCIYGLRK